MIGPRWVLEIGNKSFVFEKKQGGGGGYECSKSKNRDYPDNIVELDLLPIK